VSCTNQVVKGDLIINQNTIRLLIQQEMKDGLQCEVSDEDEDDAEEEEGDEEEKAYLRWIQDLEDEVECGKLWPLIPGKLAFTVHRDEGHSMREIVSRRDIYFFSTAFHEQYVAYCDDFGPVNLATLYEFCHYMTDKLTDPRLSERELCYYAEKDIRFRTNAAFLLGAFLMLTQGYSPAQAIKPFRSMGTETFLPFRDATHQRPPTFQLSLLDCFRGLHRAASAAWFDLKTFDVNKYIMMDDADGFALNQVCPKFVAFRGPDVRDQRLRRPRDFERIFHRLGVTDVIRLNEIDTYNSSSFTKRGFQHHDLQFEDCTAPPLRIVHKFLEVVKKSKGVVAVHCLAGLGRTGTLIALWMMLTKGAIPDACPRACVRVGERGGKGYLPSLIVP
jgi:cell division cycle 14